MDTFITWLQTNAFKTLEVETHQLDTQGWVDGGFDHVFSSIISQKFPNRPITIIEVGSWKGASAIRMLDVCKRNGTTPKLICVDTWLGSPEFYTPEGLSDPTRGECLDTVFDVFKKNIKTLGYHDSVAPLRLSSIQAADVLEKYGVKADIIYIDAAHEYEPVLSDIKAYARLLAPGGIMFGDDYTQHWPGVIHAVNHYTFTTKSVVQVYGGIWIMSYK